MYTNATTRRATLLLLFLTVSVAGAVGPASALIPAPGPDGGTEPSGSSDPWAAGLLPWVLVGLVVALAATAVGAIARRRQRSTRPTALPAT